MTARSPSVLIVEDEHALALALAATVQRVGATSETAATATRAGKMLASAQAPFDLMILDIGLPDRNGLDFLSSLDDHHRPPTLVITAHGEIHHTIAARKLGVTDFLTKPLDFEAFEAGLRRLLKPARPDTPAQEPTDTAAFIGAAPTMRPVFQQIAHCCAATAPVLVRGETGSGKSHVARVIRENGPGHDGPAEILFSGPGLGPEEIDQSLVRSRGGVLVIEELGRLREDAQAELVRHLDTRPDLPRLIATSDTDLREHVTENRLRSDLFYRLQILEVRLPPLRERSADLPALATYFLGRLEASRTVDISDAALARLAAHDWPGNLRELHNALAYALTVSARASQIEATHLPAHLAGTEPPRGRLPRQLVAAIDSWLEQTFDPASTRQPNYRELAETLEGQLIQCLLKRHEGKLARLASALGANRTTLRQRLRKLDSH
jgi:DNA-binding NtrC family response regulator